MTDVRSLAARLALDIRGPSMAAMATTISPTYAITPAHVASGTETPNVVVDREHDLALWPVHADLRVVPEVRRLADVLGPFPDPGAAWESYVRYQGSPGGEKLSGVVRGRHREADSAFEHIDLGEVALAPGSSGAPVVVGDRVVGIVAATIENRALAIPVHLLLQSTLGECLRVSVLDFDPMLRGLSRASRDVLFSAAALREVDGRDKVHIEHLVGALIDRRPYSIQRMILSAKLTAVSLREIVEVASQRKLAPMSEYRATPFAERPPALSSHVREAIESARSIAQSTGSRSIEPGHLLYGVLTVGHCEVKDALAEAGLRSEVIAQFLESPKADLAGFRSDDPNGEDKLGIGDEVRALAAVIAAKNVMPPLSIGLFGDWGSGKTFFMRKVESHIRDLEREEQASPAGTAYCRRIVQIWFNAWHYVDADLWANLTSEILRSLSADLERDQNVNPTLARERLLSAMSNAKTSVVQAEEQKKVLEAEQATNEQRIRELAQVSEQVQASLSSGQLDLDAWRTVLEKPEVREQMKAATQALNIPAARSKEPELMEQLGELRGLIGRLTVIWEAIKSGSYRGPFLQALIGAAAIAIVTGQVLPMLGIDSNMVWSYAGTALAGAIAFLRPFVSSGLKALELVDRVREEQAQRIEAARKEREAELEEKQRKVREQLAQAEAQQKKSKEEAEQIEVQLAQMRADVKLSTYVKERNAADDYTKHFGSIARARRDFQRLSELLQRTEDEPKRDDLPDIDRIVLYIDDLDRCPEAEVVKVLTAVHLLCAFPLFVVVVGVDARWLLHSLRLQSAAFRAVAKTDGGISEEELVHWQSTPLNYLEKIFQIPINLRHMGPSGFRALIEEVAKPRSTTAKKTSELEPVTPQPIAAVPGERQETADPAVATDPATTERKKQIVPVDPNPDYLSLDDFEIEFMAHLQALIQSPRAAKRFVNVYRLIRAQATRDDPHGFIAHRELGAYRAVLLLLAMLTGFPSETTDVLRDLLEDGVDASGDFWPFLERYRELDPEASDNVAERWRRLMSALAEIKPRTGDIAIEHCIDWAPEVARYSFESGRILFLSDHARIESVGAAPVLEPTI